jgi:deoxyribose-phosphate aldolase
MIVQPALAALQLMDLTSLNNSDNHDTISQLCRQAHTAYGAPAAVCVYPEWITWARLELDRLGLAAVKVATVTNFPAGSSDIERALAETSRAAAAGADEVDVVFPYKALIAGDAESGAILVRNCKAACAPTAKLKVIIESGVLETPDLIRRASMIAIENGADFIKTSTGKVAVNATLEAAEIMLQCIKDSGAAVGFKAAGGVKTVADAAGYMQLAMHMMGSSWLTANHFRFGASGLLQQVIAELSGGNQAPAEGY